MAILCYFVCMLVCVLGDTEEGGGGGVGGSLGPQRRLHGNVFLDMDPKNLKI